MNALRVLARSAIWLAVAACGDAARSRQGAWDDHAPPRLTVALPGPAAATVVWDTVRMVRAPAVWFDALLRPDPNHIAAISASASGVLRWVRRQGVIRRGDTLAVVAPRSPAAKQGAERAMAESDGTWRPRRQEDQFVWQGDTLGYIELAGYWLAVGAVYGIEAFAIHPGDPAKLLTRADSRRWLVGRVESVQPPGVPYPYSAEVAVEFRAREVGPDRVTSATVIVMPADSGDVVPAVPASAVVELPLGRAVFVPVRAGAYDLRWVIVGPVVGRLVTVREGVTPGESVASRGLEALVAVARDSLANRGLAPAR
jgi:hypothetical protein